MQTILEIFIALSLGLSASCTAVPVTNSCVAEFQESLSNTIRLKEKCGEEAAFENCCKVKTQNTR